MAKKSQLTLAFFQKLKQAKRVEKRPKIMDLASKKLNWQPCYKPPAHLTCRTALAFDCLYPVQPNRLRCRETRNKSITAERITYWPALRRMLYVFHTINWKQKVY